MAQFVKSHDSQPVNEFVRPPDYDKQRSFMQNAVTVLKSFKNYRPDIFTLDKLVRGNSRFEIYDMYSCNLIEDMTDYLGAGINQRENCRYMMFLKKIYFMFSAKDKLKFAERFVDTWQSLGYLSVPHFESNMNNYDESLATALQRLQANPRSWQTIQHEISWLMLMSPPNTVQQLLMMCIEHPHLIPTVISLCRLVPSLFYERKLKVARQRKEVTDEKLLIVVLRRIICGGRLNWKRAALWDNFGALAIALCEETPDLKPLISRQSLVELMFSDLCSKNRKPVKSVETIARITNTLMDTRSRTPFHPKLAISMRDQPEEGLLLVPSLMKYLLPVLTDSAVLSENVVASVKGILQSLADRMKEEGRVFDDETKNHLIEKELSNAPWWIDFCMCTWFFSALTLKKRRLPCELLLALPEEIKEHFELRGHIEDADPLDSYLTAIFKLGSFDMERAMEVINLGCTVNLGAVSLDEKIEKLGINMNCGLEPAQPSISLDGSTITKKLARIEIMGNQQTAPKPNPPQNRRRGHGESRYSANELVEDLVPATQKEVRRFLTILAIEAPLPPPQEPVIWPSEKPAPIYGLREQIEEQRRMQKQREEELRKKYIEREEGFLTDLKQKWATSGVYDRKNCWRESVGDRQESQRQCLEYGNAAGPSTSVDNMFDQVLRDENQYLDKGADELEHIAGVLKCENNPRKTTWWKT